MTWKITGAPGTGDDLLYSQAGTPTLDLRFASSKSLNDNVSGQNLIDFTRAGTGVGTYVGSDGLIKNSVVNLLLQSEDFSTTWTTVNASISTNAITSPTGQLTADKIIEDTNTGTHNVQQNVAVISGTSYTFSVYVKSAERSAIALRFSLTSFGALVTASYNLTSQTATVVTSGTSTSASIIAVGDGWYRCSLTSQATASATTAKQILLENPAGTRSYTGDNTSGIYFWGAQLEQSSSAGEYVKTTSSISGAPRFDHDPATGESLGLLIEGQRGNLLLRSEEFDNATVWTPNNGTVSPNTDTSPDGTLSADKFIPDAASSTYKELQQNAPVTTGTVYTFSQFVKAAGYRYVQLVGNAAAFGTFSVNFDLQNGVETSFAAGTSTVVDRGIHDYGNGWYRVFSSVTCISTTSGRMAVNVIPAEGSVRGVSWSGDGSSGVLFWGAQLEAGAFPTSYIPATSTTVTRNADVAQITGSNFSRWYSQSQGTVFARGRTNAVYGGVNDFPRLVEINSSGATADAVSLTYGVLSTVTDLRPDVRVGSISQASFTNTNATNNDQPVALAYAQNSFASAAPNYLSTDDSGNTPVVNTAYIGSYNSSSGRWNGTIRRICFFDRRLPNATLQAMTAFPS